MNGANSQSLQSRFELPVHFLFANNEMWNKVLQLMTQKKLIAGETQLAKDFLSTMSEYLRNLFDEYQEGASPCITHDQADQLRMLLCIPRTSIDLKRRKKNVAEGVTAGFAIQNESLLPVLPSMQEFVLMSQLQTSHVTVTTPMPNERASTLVNELEDISTKNTAFLATSTQRPSSPDASTQGFAKKPLSPNFANCNPFCGYTEYCETSYAKGDSMPDEGSSTLDEISLADEDKVKTDMATTERASLVKPTKSHALYDLHPLMDVQSLPSHNGFSHQMAIDSKLTKKLDAYIRSNRLHTFFRNYGVFGYNGKDIIKSACGTGKTRDGNEYRLHDLGKNKYAKRTWQVIQTPSLDSDMVWVYPNDCIGHNDILAVMMENGFGNVLSAIGEQEGSTVDHLSIVNFAFLVSRKNTKFCFHLDHEPRLQGQAWTVIIPLEIVRKSQPELCVKPSHSSTARQHQLVKYKRHTIIILGAKQWHSTGKYEYKGAEQFRCCLSVTVCHIIPENVNDIVKNLEANYPLPSPDWLLEELATQPQWKSIQSIGESQQPSTCPTMQATASDAIVESKLCLSTTNVAEQSSVCSNDTLQTEIAIGGASEDEQTILEVRKSPRRQLPHADTVMEDSGFEKFVAYGHNNWNTEVISWTTDSTAFGKPHVCLVYGNALVTLRDGEWLNDDVMNAYYFLLHEQNFKGKLFFHTTFAGQLLEKGVYTFSNAVRYFTGKRSRKAINIFMNDELLFPVNVGGSHWILIQVLLVEKMIKIYDSIGCDVAIWVDRIIRYICDEYQRLYSADYLWKDQLLSNVITASCPKQNNSWDCGVYVCLFGYYIGMGKELNFSPKYVASYRRTIAKCLLTRRLFM